MISPTDTHSCHWSTGEIICVLLASLWISLCYKSLFLGVLGWTCNHLCWYRIVLLLPWFGTLDVLAPQALCYYLQFPIKCLDNIRPISLKAHPPSPSLSGDESSASAAPHLLLLQLSKHSWCLSSIGGLRCSSAQLSIFLGTIKTFLDI